jgi:predicted nucleic acid-binding protein
MIVVADTNILLRLLDRKSGEHLATLTAVNRLTQDGHELTVCAQVMIEFWSVSTRPASANGLGVSAVEAAAFLRYVTNVMRVLPEPPDVGARWWTLVESYGVISKQAHDARLVALMNAHGMRKLLTRNVTDFKRFAEVDCVTPEAVVAGAAP